VSKNQLVVQQQLKQLYSLYAATGDTKELDLKILEGSIQQDALLEALITLIVVHNLSFCLVEWPAFHTFCQVLNKACKGKITTSHLGVRNKVSKAFVRHQATVRTAV